MTRIRFILLGLLLGIAGSIQAQILCQEFVYEPEDFPSCHASTIVCLQNGDLVTAFFGGSYEGSPDVCIWVCRKIAGSDSWSKPMMAADGVINDTLRKACYNPVLYQMPDGELLLFFKIGSCVADWTGWLTRSHDNGATWIKREPLPEGYLGPIKNKPELIDNRLVCPSSTENGNWKIHFEIYDLDTHQWHKTPAIEAALAPSLQEPGKITPIGAIQPSIIQLADGTLQVLCRTQNGHLATSYSHDGGENWSRVELTNVPNNCSGTDAVTVHPTLHALVYNPVQSVLGDYRDPRTPIDVATSMDGIYWNKLVTLDHEPGCEFSYPAVVADPTDGTLHITYTWKRQRIVYAHVKP